ncbi:hypothetical protein CAEBREN_18269 [Caenorhabditis brenneri]|uniref:Pre-mRNA-splicing factor SPF27 n=1 Tax=Caenorhabditis brenneri TaxID=135651 RepID=G0N2T4_CAEBE|nr:hypothetical protein CAEBREN_18269 [Caenorhabditis brenneri]
MQSFDIFSVFGRFKVQKAMKNPKMSSRPGKLSKILKFTPFLDDSSDGHIGLYKSLKGCQAHHQHIENSYLIPFFSNFLQHKITPIVVFDTCNAKDGDQEEFVAGKKRGSWNLPGPNATRKSRIFAPGDGEAQCAQLEASGETSKCITTDFDYFLFGGKDLYLFDFTVPVDTLPYLDTEYNEEDRQNAMKHSKAQNEHLLFRQINLELMDEYATESYLQRNKQMETLLTEVEKELRNTKEAVMEVHASRKREQMKAGEKVKQLNHSWVQMVTNNYKMEIENRQMERDNAKQVKRLKLDPAKLEEKEDQEN